MEDYRQPKWAILVLLFWLACGVALLASVGSRWVVPSIAVFVVTTAIAFRAVYVLMDREEKQLPLQAFGALAVLAAVVALIVIFV